MATRRRTRLLVLLVLLGLVAAACGGGDDSGGGGGGGGDDAACPVDALDDAGGPVQVEFWHGMTADNEETLKALTDEYNSSQDKVKVKLVFQGGYDDIREKYVAALRGGKLPDLVQLEETAIQLMIDSKSAMPAQACVDAEDYDLSDHLPVVIDEFSVEDQLWPMPFNVSNPVLYYDKAAFERAGLDPEDPPSTFDEVQAAATQITESGADESGFAFATSAWYFEQWFAMADEPILNNANGRSGRATEAVFGSETGTEILTFLQEMVDDGTGLSVGTNTSGFDNLLALGNKKAAMTVETSAALGSVITILESGQFPDVKLGVAPLPGPTGGGPLVGGAALWMVDRSPDPEKAAAWDYVKFLNEAATQATWSARTGYIPVRKGAEEEQVLTERWATYPELRVAYDQLAGSKAEVSGPVVGAYAEMRTAIEGAIERTILQGADPADAAKAAEQDATDAIQSYNERIGE